MKKSTKILVGGVFLVAVVFSAEALFLSLGFAYGATQLVGSVLAGLAGGIKLVS